MHIRARLGLPLSHQETISFRGTLCKLLIVLLHLLPVTILFLTTPWGIGTSPDSVGYIADARQMVAAGSPVTVLASDTLPSPQRAPLYPLLLAGIGLVGFDPYAAARWLHLFLFSANLLLAALIILRFSRYSLTPLLGVFLLGSSVALLTIHAFAWSEPLFILLALLGFVLLADYLHCGRLWKLGGAALLLGLACLTRYAGLPLIVTSALVLLVCDRMPVGRRLRDALILSFTSALPLVLWLLRNRLVAGTLTSREIAFHPVAKAHFWQLLYTLSGWLQIPSGAPDFLRIALCLALLAGGLFLVVHLAQHRKQSWAAQLRTIPPLLLLLALFIPIYSAFLLLSLSFVDANTPLDDRILSPILVCGLIIALIAAERAVALLGKRGKGFLGLGLALLAIASALNGVTWARQHQTQGLGFSSPTWHQSPLLREVTQLPADTLIFSNAPEAIYLIAGREAFPLPRKTNAMAQTENTLYSYEVRQMRERLQQEKGVVVYFRGLEQRPVTGEEELEGTLSLHPARQAADGAIYAPVK